MAKKITMKEAKRGAQMPMGKGWRLVTPSRTRYFKVTVMAAPSSLWTCPDLVDTPERTKVR
jgi:hypothetical protein